MPRYCLDADTFIESNKGPYSLDVHKTFWKWLDQQNQTGVIFSSSMVYDELIAGNDSLAEWAKARKDSGLFLHPTQEVQATLTQIADHVIATYDEPEARHFLDGADPWVIAQAKAEGAMVVTYEKKVPINSTKVKIPNVCIQFDVEWRNIFQMTKELKAEF